jgi:predicted GNAT family acetyltransferase
VNQRRYIVCAVAAWASAALVSPCAAQDIALCRAYVLEREPVRRGGDARDGGVVWFRVAFQHGVEPAHQKAFEGGMELWNARRASTRVAFELAKSSIIDLRIQRGAPVYVRGQESDTRSEINEVKMNDAEANKCAEFVADGPYIWYSPNLLRFLDLTKPGQTEKWLEQDVRVLMKTDRQFRMLAKMYAHELGHMLAIDHNRVTTGLMRKGAADKMCWEQELADMQDADAEVATACVWRERNDPQRRPVEEQP